MKNTLYLLMILVLSSFALPPETITISGKISNTEEKKIKIKGESFNKEITLKPDGSFSETFPINYSGSYTLSTKNNRAALYLAKGTKLNITADDANFNTSLAFTGNGSIENQYLVKKGQLVNTMLGNPQTFYSQDETTYVNKNKELKNAVLELYNSTKFADAGFKKNEQKSIDYFEQLLLLNYPAYHAHYAKKENFKPSESFPKFDTTLDMDNDTDFLFSNPYKQLIAARFNQKVSENSANMTEKELSDRILTEIKKIKSPNIKNSFLQNLGYQIRAGNTESETLYKEIMALSTDTKFKEDLTAKFNKIKGLIAGKPSPKFNYENYKGGQTSLDNLKGKFVYIDVWATWCGPCRQEIPHLQKVEEQYHGKNIEFVSISIDAKKDYDKWKKLVDEKKLGGIQLFADNDWSSQFIKEYGIESIPRFILVDPNGNIVTADAPRPSDPQLTELFTKQGVK
ncbi:MAG TPA: TlpA disulfide reductase family protein [Flavobacterium sp.]|nr:TlpA disulfide reductase family protein [Flavobacterium sp.]